MIFWICCLLTLGAAATATFVGDMRRAVLALWLAGLGVGGLYLSMGAELLAIIQWVICTLIAISFIFYAVMFGEYGVPDSRPASQKILNALMPVSLGIAFALVVWIGARSLPKVMVTDITTVQQVATESKIAQQNVAALGKTMVEEHLLSLEILALMLFLVIVGSGVVARPEVLEK